MPKTEPRKIWHAEVTLIISRLALAVQYLEEGRGSNKKRVLKATDWLDADGKTVRLDAGKRLKGWVKEQALTLGGETKRDLVGFGVSAQTSPSPGFVPVGTLDDLAPSSTWGSFKDKDTYMLNGFPPPEVEGMITTEGRSVYAMFFVLAKPVQVKVKVSCFARGFTHEQLKDWMEQLGGLKGLGDKHNSSSGYGLFSVKEFKFIGEKVLQY